MCIWGQHDHVPPPYTLGMPLESIKALIAAVWVSAIWTAGTAGNVRSVSQWTVLVGLAVVPPLITLWRWNEHRPTMSEIIHEARR
jgi:hypothetical protein